MSLNTQFSFVCQRQFSELTGDSDVKRFCDTCKTQVINLDRLDEEGRLRVFEEAARTRIIPCVSITTQLAGSQKCGESVPPLAPLPPPRPTAGLPKMPENLQQERERLEQLRAESAPSQKNPDQAPLLSLLSRLKFW